MPRHTFPAFTAALDRVHNPESPLDALPDSVAWRRLAYDEFLAGQVSLALVRARVRKLSGQPLTGSFTDYAIPRASDAPSFATGYHSVPATTNILGAKGCGEAGCAGSLPSVMNALVDALGGKHINMPATPERVWEALHQE